MLLAGFTGTGRWRRPSGPGCCANQTVAENRTTQTATRNGKVTSTRPLQQFLEPAKYKCRGDTMLQYSDLGNFSEEYARS